MIVEFDYNITITIWVDGQLDGVNLMIFVKNFLDRIFEMSGFWSGSLSRFRCRPYVER